ncbi:TPA: hypothetical protein MXR76_002002 [Pseudomonas aeruginosa]|uniref:hypothetical protein n=1 Tax=Pseudomonas aeruginosa TaxID=287 RepID=UPI00287D06F2|nr:hypothetical protein [Pseudomonas aeruginosa]EKF7417576.1 hypothetical protein [Pseudomonas aeruginosa]MDS9914864.1 hypothetical protein [Pseudomonas aeruginosa]HBO1619138.1 hypothetical protein [Pseudomonas aeruginosa]HCA5864525.1 hypothetical protein [Pseudomonas aeruginosa]HCA7378163.1 hypothetical protein [Pseudomonas aeruginosa]
MLNMHWLALPIATALVSGPVGAAVVCEFEPTPDMADCSRCFKADIDGSSLFLGGKRAASGTDPERFHQIRVGSVVYQRGVEKVAYSKRNGVAKLFEVCYENAPTVKASSIVLDMDPDADIQEFELRVDRGLPSAEYEFALVSTPTPAEGAAGVFGNTLVFSPSSQWSGKTVLSYSVAGPDGRASTGKITIRRQRTPVEAPVVKAEVDVLAEQLVSLQASLESLQLQLAEEAQLGSESLEQIKLLEEALAERYRAVADLDRQIAEAEAVLLKRRNASYIARLERLFGVTLAQVEPASALHTLDLLARAASPLWLPSGTPVQSSQTTFLVPYFGSPVPFRRSFDLQPGGTLDKSRKRRLRAQRDQDQPVSRRLTKREKKLAKRARKKKAP